MDEATPILGGPQAIMADLMRVLDARASKHNDAERLSEIAAAYVTFGRLTGIGSRVPFAQAAHETGWFSSEWWKTANNPAGIGVTGEAGKGERFNSVAAGVLAHYAHLLAYATTDSMLGPEGLLLLPFDRRIKAMGVKARGTAPRWVDLGGKWAVSKDYGRKVLKVADTL
jgi:N-acetylmuramoyl-L-alanine amidase